MGLHRAGSTLEGGLATYSAADSFFPPPANASRVSLLIASGLEGFGSGWRAIQASSSSSKSECIRTPMVRPLPVAGRPIFFFSRSAIARVLTFG